MLCIMCYRKEKKVAIMISMCLLFYVLATKAESNLPNQCHLKCLFMVIGCEGKRDFLAFHAPVFS